MERCGFTYRALGSLIDSFLFSFLFFSVAFTGCLLTRVPIRTFLAAMDHARQHGSASEPAIRLLIIVCIALLVPLVIVSLPELFFGVSPGKLLLGIRIKTEDGEPAPFFILIFRFVLKHPLPFSVILSIPLTIFGIMTHQASIMKAILATVSLGELCSLVITFGLLCALGESRQTLHDKIAGTAVYPKEVEAALEDNQLSEPITQPAHSQPSQKEIERMFKSRW